MSSLDELIQEVNACEDELDELELRKAEGAATVEQVTEASIRVTFAKERLWIEQQKTRR